MGDDKATTPHKLYFQNDLEKIDIDNSITESSNLKDEFVYVTVPCLIAMFQKEQKNFQF